MASRVGIMGGTFDPIHHGHLVAASEVADQLNLDRVLFVPTGQPWQKNQRDVSPAEDRYVMTVLATAGDPRFDVSRVDIDRPGPTYTVDTLTDLYEQLGSDAQLFFITGADALAQIAGWREFERVTQLAHLVGVTRPGHTVATTEIVGEPILWLTIPALAISSTDCRERIAQGRPISYLVPESVARFVAKRGLYLGGACE